MQCCEEDGFGVVIADTSILPMRAGSPAISCAIGRGSRISESSLSPERNTPAIETSRSRPGPRRLSLPPGAQERACARRIPAAASARRSSGQRPETIFQAGCAARTLVAKRSPAELRRSRRKSTPSPATFCAPASTMSGSAGEIAVMLFFQKISVSASTELSGSVWGAGGAGSGTPRNEGAVCEVSGRTTMLAPYAVRSRRTRSPVPVPMASTRVQTAEAIASAAKAIVLRRRLRRKELARIRKNTALLLPGDSDGREL